MENNKLGQEQAFPSEETYQSGFDSFGNKEFITNRYDGMSKRFYAACMAMQGLLASGNFAEGIAYNPIISKLSFEIADELLKQENL